MTSDGMALFRAICEQPGEDTPRLMYADWLQENDQPQRAEFIRIQCEARAVRPGYLSQEDRERMTTLLREHGPQWRGELASLPGVEWNPLFVRGFVEHADVSARANFDEQLARVFATTPLVRLIVHDLDERRLRILLECSFLDRLTTLAMPDLQAYQLTTTAKNELLEVARRLENTRFLYHRS